MSHSSLTEPIRKHEYAQVFLLCAIFCGLLYLPYLIADGGLFHYAGDFNGQQITFYQYANAFVKNGGGSFSWQTDLGSGFVNSYSFYFVGSPFWWLSLLIPTRLMPYCMVPMLCLKFGLAGGGGYLWLKRYVRDSRWAVLGGVLYALSGFAIYNVFFNHFVDVIALFPYLLWALDATVYDGRRGVFPALVALNFVNNYFFFVGQILFLLIYFICKLSAGEYKLTGRLFGSLALESLLGCGIGCVLAIPALLSLAQNPRTVDLSSGYGFLMYGKVQQYFAILYSLFLMPDPPYQLNLWSEGVIKWTSMTAYLPLCSCAGVLTWIKYKEGSAFKRVLCTCLVFAFVPVLNSAFYALNSSYYARWFYMPVLIMAACTVCGLEERLSQSSGVAITLAVMASSIAFAVVPVLDTEEDTWSFGLVNDPPKFWLMLLVSVGGVALFWHLLQKHGASRRLPTVLLTAVVGWSFLYGNVHVAYTKLSQWDHDANFVEQCYQDGPVLGQALPEDHFYRVDAYDCYDNLGLWIDKPVLQFFCSTVAPSILSFYPDVGVTRDVSSKPEPELYALRGLLSAEFCVMPAESESEWLAEELQGWSRWGTAGSYVIYQNENYLPMGFAYEHYLTEEQFQAVPTDERGNLLLKALVLTEEQIEAYGDLLEPLSGTDRDAREYEDYVADCSARRQTAASSFEAQKNGFTATINLERENLVFFSVPYDDGFTATVNGQPAQIERVDGGLMAVLAPAGQSTIVFTYHTYGLGLSGGIALGSGALYLAYLLWLRRKCRPEQADGRPGWLPADREKAQRPEPFTLERSFRAQLPPDDPLPQQKRPEPQEGPEHAPAQAPPEKSIPLQQEPWRLHKTMPEQTMSGFGAYPPLPQQGREPEQDREGENAL